MVKVSHRFGCMGRFKGGLKCKGWVNRVIIHLVADVITFRYF